MQALVEMKKQRLFFPLQFLNDGMMVWTSTGGVYAQAYGKAVMEDLDTLHIGNTMGAPNLDEDYSIAGCKSQLLYNFTSL
jgi:hypothetical protein